MHMKVVLLALVLLCAGRAGATRLLAFYEARPAGTPPTIDGVFDDTCWARAPTASTYFKYWVPDPIPGELDTAFQMLYDERGIYLAITNYEEDIDISGCISWSGSDGTLTLRVRGTGTCTYGIDYFLFDNVCLY